MESETGAIAIVHEDVLVRDALATIVRSALPCADLRRFATFRELDCRPETASLKLLLMTDEPIRADEVTVREVRRRANNAYLVLVTCRLSREWVVKALVDGASAYISYDMDARHIAQVLDHALCGRTQIPRLPDSNDKDRVDRRGNLSGASNLTSRQREVAALLQQGMSNKQIGRSLGISEATVKVHVSAILHAINASNRMSAVIRLR